MPAITSAVWRVEFKYESLNNFDNYSQDFVIANGKQPALDFAKAVEQLGFIDVVTRLIMVV